MKKRQYILLAVLLILAAAVVCVGIHFYPIWKSAEILQENMDSKYFSYELQAELDEETLSEEQSKLFDIMAKLTGYKKEALCRLTIKGSVWEDKIHALVYPENATDALLEFYLSDGMDVINETIIYNAIRAHLVDQYTLLGYLMPEQKDDLYMTLEQLEQIFDIDLNSLREWKLPSEDRVLSKKQCFAMLAAMSREKQTNGNRFKMETEQMQLQFDVSTAGDTSAVVMHLYMQETGDSLKNLSVDLRLNEGMELVIPKDFVSQGTVELISEIRAWIKNIFGEE